MLDMNIRFGHIAGTMTLEEYFTMKRLRGERITESEFAEAVGLSQPHVNRLRRGVGWPSRKAAIRITAATGGMVTANDFQAKEAAE